MKDFEARKRLLRERNSQKHSVPKQLASLGRDLSLFPFLQVCLYLSCFHAFAVYYSSRVFNLCGRLHITFRNRFRVASPVSVLFYLQEPFFFRKRH